WSGNLPSPIGKGVLWPTGITGCSGIQSESKPSDSTLRAYSARSPLWAVAVIRIPIFISPSFVNFRLCVVAPICTISETFRQRYATAQGIESTLRGQRRIGFSQLVNFTLPRDEGGHETVPQQKYNLLFRLNPIASSCEGFTSHRAFLWCSTGPGVGGARPPGRTCTHSAGLGGVSRAGGGGPPQPLGEIGAPLVGAHRANRQCQRFRLGDHDHEPFAPGHAGIEQVALQQREMLGAERQHYGGILRALTLMDRGRIGECELIEFTTGIRYRAALEIHVHYPFLQVNLGDASDIAVEHLFVVVVDLLEHFIARRIGPAKPLQLWRCGGIELLLQRTIE